MRLYGDKGIGADPVRCCARRLFSAPSWFKLRFAGMDGVTIAHGMCAILILTVFFLSAASFAWDKGDKGAEPGAGREMKVARVSQGEVVNKDWFGAGNIVEVSGTVNGDVYVAGGSVLVDGTVNGDVLAAGGVVIISGTVSQNVRAAGGRVAVNGHVGRNLTVAGGDVELTGSSKVAGSIVAAGRRIALDGPVGGDVLAAGSNLTVSNAILGDLQAAVRIIRLTSKATVNGNLTYWSDRTALIDENARVAGVVTHNIPAHLGEAGAGIHRFFLGLWIATRIISVVSTLIIGLIMIRLFPGFNAAAVSALRKRPWGSLGLGFIYLIMVPVVFIILLITIAGIPLAFILIALYSISLYVSRVFVISWAGGSILERFARRGPYLSFAAGWVVWSIIIFIPVVGYLAAFLITLFGLGAGALASMGLYREGGKKGIV